MPVSVDKASEAPSPYPAPCSDGALARCAGLTPLGAWPAAPQVFHRAESLRSHSPEAVMAPTLSLGAGPAHKKRE